MKTALTVTENLALLGGLSRRAAARPATRRWKRSGSAGIGHLPFGYLSTGQKRRAAIARLLVSRRPIWLLDEPTAGLDARSEGEFAVLANEHLQSGGIIVAATHQPLGIAGAKKLAIGNARRCLSAFAQRGTAASRSSSRSAEGSHASVPPSSSATCASASAPAAGR